MVAVHGNYTPWVGRACMFRFIILYYTSTLSLSQMECLGTSHSSTSLLQRVLGMNANGPKGVA